MDKKVSELVEWAARKVNQKAKYYDGTGVGWDNLTDNERNIAIDEAKQILSHPDLALIYEDTFTAAAIQRGSIIPLAEALEE